MNKIILFILAFLSTVSLLYTQVPASPILVEPPEEASVVSLTTTLVWDAVPGANCYFIYYTDDTSVAPPEAFCMKSDNSFQIANPLNPNTKYFWFVQAHNENGWSIPSGYHSFTTIATGPIGAIQNLMDQVNSVSSAGLVSNNQAAILENRLNQAIHQIELDHPVMAILDMAIFKLRVFILRLSGMIPESDAISLNYSADGVIDLIQTLGPMGGTVTTELSIPREFVLRQNYPNPFNPATTIEYTIPDNSFVSLKIYDMVGKEVAEIVNKFQEHGSYITTWDASRFSSGVYIYKLTAGPYSETKKMILSK